MLTLLPLAAKADITLDPKLSGTGTNVVFDSGIGTNTIVGSLNGKHDNLVDFINRSNTAGFTGAKSGNDIKILDTSDLGIDVFAADGITRVGTTEQVFTLKGSGVATLTVTAVDKNGVTEAPFSFSPFVLNATKPSEFTLLASNGEVMMDLDINVVGGMISEFEHFRIDVAGVPTVVVGVPEPSTWALMGLGFAFVGLFGMRQRGRGFRLA